MPRTSRFITEFDADGKRWVAEFVHQHAVKDTSGKVKPIIHQIKQGPEMGKFIDLQHLTTCKLRYKGESTFVTGHAPCSLKDTYNWRKGIHYSLQRAMERARFCKLEKVGGKMVVVERKPIYDLICAAFWQEVFNKPAIEKFGEAAKQIKLPATVVPRAEHGMGAVAEDPHLPTGTQNGTYHMGAD